MTGYILTNQALRLQNFFMLNSAEHEIFPANKSQITEIANSFLPNIAEHETFSANKYENANYFDIFIFISSENLMQI